MIHARWLVLLTAVGAVLGVERVAAACDCDPVARSVPGDGATDVPLNARLVVRSVYRDRWTNHRLVRVVDGALVDVRIQGRDRPNSDDRVYVVTPMADLEAETSYQFVVGVDDPQVMSTFTTGRHRLTEPPRFEGLLDMRLETVLVADVPYEMQSSCFSSQAGWWSRIVARSGARGDEVAYVELELYPPGASVATDWMPEGYLQHTTCGTSPPPLVPWSRWCARAVAYDLAGNSAGSDTEVCADVVQCDTLAGTSIVTNPICVLNPPQAGEAGGCNSGGRPAGLMMAFLLGVHGGIRRLRRRRRSDG